MVWKEGDREFVERELNNLIEFTFRVEEDFEYFLQNSIS